MEVDSAVMESILYELRSADEIYRWKGEFKLFWRATISRWCTYLPVPFSTLRRAFEIRYGAITEESEQTVQVNASTHISNNENNSHIQLEANNNPDLDHDTILEILRRLPVPSLMRAKSICKAWNTTIFSTNFNVINKTDHFVTQQSCHGLAFFCAALNRWFEIRLPWKENTCDQNKCYHSYPTMLYLCAAADGLFLFLDFNNKPVIFNLLTNQHRFLPPPKKTFNCTAVELIVQADHFEIISVHFSNKLQLYDSSTDEWKDIPSPFQLFGPHIHHWKSTLHNGMVYFTKDFGRHLGCYGIASREFTFKEIKGGLPPQIDILLHNFYPSLPSLVTCNGKLILVARLEKAAEEGGKLWGGFPFIKHSLVGIWELDSRSPDNEKWSLISVTPLDLLEDTVKSSHGTDFMVAASSNKIWLTIRGSMNLLTFNLESMEWSVLPGYSCEDLVDSIPRRSFCAPLRISPSLTSNPPEPIE